MLWARCGFAFVFFSGLVLVHCGALGFYSLGSSGLWGGTWGVGFHSFLLGHIFLDCAGLGHFSLLSLMLPSVDCLFEGAQEFWAMGLTFLPSSRWFPFSLYAFDVRNTQPFMIF